MTDWTLERLAKEPSEKLKILQNNALRLGESELADLCKAELTRRTKKNARAKRTSTAKQSRKDQVVGGFHFVCPRETGVQMNGDDTAWIGTWVVDKKHAETGTRIGAYVALHAAKIEPSYLQGTIVDWRISDREREYAEGTPVRIDKGIDFLLQLTPAVYEWQGDGSGEKGYFWTNLE